MSDLPEPVDHAAHHVQMNRALALWFDDAFFERAKRIATYMAKAEGFTPKHLVGKSEACFLVVELALNWNLSPSRVAAATYQTPNGAVGFEGKLVHAIIEATGQIEGGVTYEHFYDVTLEKGAAKERISTIAPEFAEMKAAGWTVAARHGWDKVQGKFRKITKQKQGSRGTYDVSYHEPAWTDADEVGLGVIVRAQIKGEAAPRQHEFYLTQAQPRNSTLWATDPKTQICYAAVRRFASIAMPHVIMGVPFDGEVAHDTMVDVTPPRPERADFTNGASKTPVTDIDPVVPIPDGEEERNTAGQPGPSAAGDPEPERETSVGILNAEGADAGYWPGGKAAAMIRGFMAPNSAAAIAAYEHNEETIGHLAGCGIEVGDLTEMYQAALAEQEAAQQTDRADQSSDESAPDNRPDAEFWARPNYAIPYSFDGKRDVSRWISAMETKIDAARTVDELKQLDQDNGSQQHPAWNVAGIANSTGAKALRAKLTAAAQRLLGSAS